jgi:hypothetical protein
MNRITLALLLLFSIYTQGCASTLQAKPEHQTGSMNHTVEPGSSSDAVIPHVHAQAKVDWSAYDKIILKPVSIWDGALSGSEQETDLTGLANIFYEMLYERLSKDYDVIAHSAEGAMVIQATLIHAEPSWVAPAFLTKVSWQLQALNRVWTYFRGKPAFAGEITVEFTVRDSMTGGRLFAGTDRRVGGQNLFDKEVFNRWGDVQNSLQFWTEQSAYQLCLARRKTNCTPPKA